MSASIYFFIRSERPQKDGSAQLYMMFIVNREKSKIALDFDVPLKKEYATMKPDEIAKLDTDLRNSLYCWDSQKQRVTYEYKNKEDKIEDTINKYIVAQEKKANDLIFQYQYREEPLTLETFKTAFNKKKGQDLFAEYFLDLINAKQNTWSEETCRTYKSIVTKIQKFKPNLRLNGINYKFLSAFEEYMYTPASEEENQPSGRGNCERTVANNMKTLKTLVRVAIKNKDFAKDQNPFNDYKIGDTSKVLTTRDYLEPEEISITEGFYDSFTAPEKPMHSLSVQDWKEREEMGLVTPGEFKTLKRFLFCCYTGLRFRDMRNLHRTQIHSKWVSISENTRIEKYYIELQMHKTSAPVFIPLIDKALAMIDLNCEGLIFEPISNQKINEHLQSLQKKFKINKELTFHVARHSFATVAFLNGLDPQIVQKLLGHKNRKYTEIYTHLSHDKIMQEMEKMNKGINKSGNLTPLASPNHARIIELLPILENLSPEKFEQVSGIIKLMAG